MREPIPVDSLEVTRYIFDSSPADVKTLVKTV